MCFQRFRSNPGFVSPGAPLQLNTRLVVGRRLLSFAQTIREVQRLIIYMPSMRPLSHSELDLSLWRSEMYTSRTAPKTLAGWVVGALSVREGTVFYHVLTSAYSWASRISQDWRL
jgi:hypothetical protein